eukprot:TRINITY_DN7715_c0_g1_i1.p1 TRINITY_DN7715_c0_g1~~TRINITY_DN7715_c0_g1_i1.p1  ORF type:complete len:349 (+),score=59.27 TRINITY_DN7715_c0_g1_i1:52-1098(+)
MAMINPYIEIIRNMPKVELHAHLGGSIRLETLNELMNAKGLKGMDFTVNKERTEGSDSARMAKCFEIFDAIYKVTDGLPVIERVTKEVILDYSSENTAYLELRTSLKKFGDNTESDYLDTVLKAIKETNEGLPDDKKVPTTVLVSINRGRTLADAETAVKIAIAYKDKGVSGVDFSGNCYKGEWNTFLPLLKQAREAGLRISIHAGEKDDPAELSSMIDFVPDRIGHFVFSDEESEQRVRELKIPIEMCITSNLITSNWHPAEHHISKWMSHPISINTDDRGVFAVTLSSEYQLAHATFDLSIEQLLNISEQSLKHSFLGEDEKELILKTKFNTFRDKLKASQSKQEK